MANKNPGLTANGVSGEHFDALEGLCPGLGRAINAQFAQVANSTSELGGHKGTVNLRNKSELSKVGRTDPTLDADMGRLASVADGTADTDAVNVRQLRAALQNQSVDVDLPDDTDIQNSVCGPVSIGPRKSLDTDLTGIYAVDSMNEHIVAQGGIVASPGHFRVYHIEPDNTMVLVGSVDTTEIYERMRNDGHQAWCCNVNGGSSNIQGVDWKRPNSPATFPTFACGVQANNLYPEGRWLYVCGNGSIKIIDKSEPGNLVVVGTAL